MSAARKPNLRVCRCGCPWSQHVGTYGDGYVICAGGDKEPCKCAYQEFYIVSRRLYGANIRKLALKARVKHEQTRAFYLSMAVHQELAKRPAPKDGAATF